jgi:hypothetical protein
VDEVLDDLWYSANSSAGRLLLADGPKGSQVRASAAAQAGVTRKVVTENCGAAYQELVDLRKRGGVARVVRAAPAGAHCSSPANASRKSLALLAWLAAVRVVET